MDIKRNGTQPSGKGPTEWFTGTVRIDPLFKAPDPARVSGASVTFEPGARTAWHTHPLGQTLICAERISASCRISLFALNFLRLSVAEQKGSAQQQQDALQ